MIKYQMYIGSNNVTKELEINKIEAELNAYYDGYTITRGIGYWKGKKEEVAIVEILSDDLDTVNMDLLVQKLKSVLEQESIMLSTEITNTRFI